MSCEHCFKGVTHAGEPTGSMEIVGGIECYVATPTSDYSKHKAILYIPDAFGLPLVNNKLLVDNFAHNGFKTFLIDVFEGDATPVEFLSNDKFRDEFDFVAWLGKHPAKVVEGRINKVMSALRDQGVADFAATGYCFGGRYVFNLAFVGAIKVAAVSHPSLLKCPDDLEKYASVAKVPLLINSCTFDTQFPLEAQAQADTILKGFEWKLDSSAKK